MKSIVISVLCLLALSSGTVWADTVIIAHKDIPEAVLSEKDLQEIFWGSEYNGRITVPFIRPL